MHTDHDDEARERRQLAAERDARAESRRRALLEDPKRQAAVTAYQVERERAERQGKRVLRSIDDYRRAMTTVFNPEAA
jgi:hypothetical protein